MARKNTGLLLAAGGAAIAGVFLLTKGALGGGGGGGWTYNVACSVESSGVGSWDQVIFNATINSSAAEMITRTVDLMISRMGAAWQLAHSFVGTLEPGGTATYESPDGLILIALGETIRLKLVDSDGYESKVCTAEN